MAIKGSLILWIDLRYNKNDQNYSYIVEKEHNVFVINQVSEIEPSIKKYNPDLLIFDYDLPDQLGLQILRKTRENNSSIPFLMLTTDYSTQLAIWALRMRAWDYFVKPIKLCDIENSLNSLLANQVFGINAKARTNYKPLPEVPSESRPYNNKSSGMSTVSAADFVQQNLSSKITVETAARRCGMSKSHFSRTFKKEHGVTFQEFLINQRMDKAVELLKNSDFLVTQIAFAVGYCELSNFTTTFQRTIGIGPSSFRKASAQNEHISYHDS